MAYELPSVATFRARFPEFVAETYSDDAVGFALADAGRQVDSTWLEEDYEPAVLHLAAHLLSLSVSGAEALGDDEIRSISIGPLSLSYGDRASAAVLTSTPYGQVFAGLRRRNVPAVAWV